jgi:hypothetical protein
VTRLGRAFALALCVTAQAGPTLAAPRPGRPAAKPAARPAAPSTRVSAAEQRYQEAMQAFEAGERVRARALFEVVLADLPAAHVLYPKTLYNLAFLADAEVETGEIGAACRAETAFARYLSAAPATAEHERPRAQAETRREALADQCEAERTPVTIPVTTEESAPDPRGAWVAPTLGITGAAILGGGVALQFWARAAIDERDRARANFYDVADPGAAARQKRIANDAQNDAQFRVWASYACFGTSAVLLGVAAWMWLSAPELGHEGAAADDAPPDVGLAPGFGTLSVFGRF